VPKPPIDRDYEYRSRALIMMIGAVVCAYEESA